MEPIYVVVRTIVFVFLRLLLRFRFLGLERIPRTGGVIIAPNHISNLDPLCAAYLADRAGRRPRFLAKASLWKVWFMRVVLNGCRQIPVERGTGKKEPLQAAIRAVERGEAVVIYPEATITINPDLTPMQGKTGVARLALATGAPVVPVAQWGPQWYIAKYHRSSYRPWRVIMFNVGEPMTFAGAPDDAERVREVTDMVMAEIDRLVRELHKLHPDGAAVPPLKVPARG
jgi:1-acyl-sn-glycerol-3-phosphate acyltransferase